MPNLDLKPEKEIPRANVQVPPDAYSMGSQKALKELQGSVGLKVAQVVGVLAVAGTTLGLGVYKLNHVEEVNIPEMSKADQWAKQDPFKEKKELSYKDRLYGIFKKEDPRDKETREQHVERVMKERIEFLMGVKLRGGSDEYHDLEEIEKRIEEERNSEFVIEEARWNYLKKGYMRVYPVHTMKTVMALPLPVSGRAAIIGEEIQEIYIKKVVDFTSPLKIAFPDAVSVKEMQQEGGAVKKEEVVDQEQILKLFLDSVPRWRNEKYAHEVLTAFSMLYPKHLLENGDLLKGMFTEQERAHIVFSAAHKCPHEAIPALKMEEKDWEEAKAKAKAERSGNPHDHFRVNDKYKDVISSGTAKSLYLAAITASPNFTNCNK